MRIISGLAMLFGLFAIVNAVTEAAAAMRQGQLGGGYLAAIVLVALAGVLLIGAGVAGLRGAARTATRAAAASLVLCLLGRFVVGWMSVFAQVAGIVVPLAILAARYRRGQRGAIA